MKTHIRPVVSLVRCIISRVFCKVKFTKADESRFIMNYCKVTALALGVLFPLLGDATNISRRGGKPGLPYDPNTSSECTWWVDYDGSSDCATMLETNFVLLSDFQRWVICLKFPLRLQRLTQIRIPLLATIAQGLHLESHIV